MEVIRQKYTNEQRTPTVDLEHVNIIQLRENFLLNRKVNEILRKVAHRHFYVSIAKKEYELKTKKNRMQEWPKFTHFGILKIRTITENEISISRN